MGRRESKSYASFGLWNESDAVPWRLKTSTTGVIEGRGGNPFLLTAQAVFFEFVAFFPGDLLGLVGGFPS
jgi:hypothetical protein